MPQEPRERSIITFPTVFDTYGNERLTTWKEFRTKLETSPNPLEEVASFWSRAPFVNSFLDPSDPSHWPDPWHLVLDNRYDDLAICLGMLYTIKLTQRFMDSAFEIHMTQDNKNKNYFLVVDKTHVLNFEYGSVCDLSKVNARSSILYSGTELP